jgi:hypothetical protein
LWYITEPAMKQCVSAWRIMTKCLNFWSLRTKKYALFGDLLSMWVSVPPQSASLE